MHPPVWIKQAERAAGLRLDIDGKAREILLAEFGIDLTPRPDPNWSGDKPDPASSNAPYRLYNIGNHTPVGLMDYIAIIEKAVGKKARLNLLPKQPGDVDVTFADVSELKAATGFEPKTPLAEGIAKFVGWYRDYYKL